MKEYIDKIVENGNQEDMECLSEMLVDLLYRLKEEDHDEYKKYKNKLIGMAYNYTIDEELAHDIVEDMKPEGEIWSKETIINEVGNVSNINDIYVVMNSLANDYGSVIPITGVEQYIKLTNAWLNDPDGHKNKAWWYFVN